MLGFDRNKARDKIYTIYRPDSIMIVSINFKTKEISMASIPRDTYVKVHGRNIYDKINHSYMYGYQKPGKGDPHLSGIKSTVRTIQDFLGGVPIHYYIALDMDAVEEVIDAIGGVYYDVDVPVRDRAGKGKLVVDKGYQLLDGKKFLEMIRFRAIGGDTGRANRQQEDVYKRQPVIFAMLHLSYGIGFLFGLRRFGFPPLRLKEIFGSFREN